VIGDPKVYGGTPLQALARWRICTKRYGQGNFLSLRKNAPTLAIRRDLEVLEERFMREIDSLWREQRERILHARR